MIVIIITNAYGFIKCFIFSVSHHFRIFYLFIFIVVARRIFIVRLLVCRFHFHAVNTVQKIIIVITTVVTKEI